MVNKNYDLVGAVIAFESNQMNAEQVVEFAQYLWDTGLWRELQGSYGRFVHAMLADGHIS
jgi:hypothetical protein